MQVIIHKILQVLQIYRQSDMFNDYFTTYLHHLIFTTNITTETKSLSGYLFESCKNS